MSNEEKKQEFLEQLCKKYPEIIITEFNNLSGDIYFKDGEGYLHYKKQARRLLSHGYSVQSVLDKKTFIQDKVSVLHPDLKVLEYYGVKNKILVIDSEGLTYSPGCFDLLKGCKVTVETCNEKERFFESKSRKVHGDLYEYPNFKYVNGKQKIDIVCKKHGVFNQTIESHLLGRGCPHCKKENASFSTTDWINRYKNTLCTFYALVFSNQDETFLKVGITSKSVSGRYKNLKDYKYEKLIEVYGDSQTIANIEKRILKKYKSNRYIPKLYFEGHTECLDITVKNKIYEQLKK